MKKSIFFILLIILLTSCFKREPEISNNTLPMPADGSIVSSYPLNLSIENAEGFSITYISDNLNITGLIIKPKGTGPFPAVIYNHGNIKGTVEPNALLEFIKYGYVVLASNYRGNGGSQGTEDFGGHDVNDVLNIISSAKTLHYVDKDRLCMVGVSHGGQMSLLTLSRTSDIKAAALLFPITDLLSLSSYYENVDPNNSLLKLLQFEIGGSIKTAPEKYRKRSPINYVNEINTPILILHGEEDKIVPPDQSKRLADELSKYGKTYKAKYYKGQGHGFSGNADIDSKKLIADWLKHYSK